MSKLFFVFVSLAISVFVQGAPLTPVDDIVQAASAGEWDKVQSLFANNFGGLKDLGVKDLKPFQGGHVYGESEYTYHSRSDFGGQTSEKSGGHKVINEDGKVAEFDFKPTVQPEEFFKNLGLKPFDFNAARPSAS